MNKIILSLLIILPAIILTDCANVDLTPFSGLLSQTGIMSGSQADSLLRFGDKASKGLSRLSDEEEYYLGRGVAATVLAKYRPYRNASVNKYVNKVGATVAVYSDRPETFGGYHVLVLDSNEINAMSAPGGFIFITSGFLKLIPDEDALAAILAHEVGHIVKAHGLKAISEANLTDALLTLGKESAQSYGGAITSQLTSTFGKSVTDITNTLLVKGYARSQEYEADKVAGELLKQAGYNPGALNTVLSRLETASVANTKSGWFSTHPEPEDRLDEVSDLAQATVAITPAQELRTKRFLLALKPLGVGRS